MISSTWMIIVHGNTEEQHKYERTSACWALLSHSHVFSHRPTQVVGDGNCTSATEDHISVIVYHSPNRMLSLIQEKQKQPITPANTSYCKRAQTVHVKAHQIRTASTALGITKYTAINHMDVHGMQVVTILC